MLSVHATQASANPSEPLELPDLVRTIADFLSDRDLCTFSQLSKLHHESLRDNIQTRKEQKDARAEMVRLWDEIRGHPSWNWIFGGKLIGNASSKAAIQHLLHQMDGRANVRCLEITGKRYAANLPHGTPSGRPLFQKIQQYQQRWLVGGHPVYNPPHRYERVRCGLSNAKMSLFDEHIGLFIELRTVYQRFKEIRTEKPEVKLSWSKVMEIIGAQIGYPNMAFYYQRDLSHDAFRAFNRRILDKWATVIIIDDTIQRVKSFQKRVEKVRSFKNSCI